ncbi:hypothetical protein [Mesorhizobium ventifaucium]|uniref:Uncharacterized protein n=1 Tax=Mesorhizobium ventifaucium TaxID=666020 RepID=A0ABM9DFB8_9HYPH|nr:hypothetical protein [Mesorhizobium ventifaucium]CAH2395260.1 hypothetical protein MES4922_120053 [Mesorhizobium ventifaucium]
MSELTNEEIEGRLNAQRETLALVVALLAGLEATSERIWAELEARFQFQNNQEDPSPMSATLHQVRIAAEWPGHDATP